jgi:glycosyltransferase involved in cell wall biosynthesis
VIIPTRNRPASLANLLFSIVSQTVLPDEVLIVDDSNNTKTAELVNDLSDVFFSRGIVLKYLQGNKENMSISAARNIGIEASTGEIIFFMDDDIILHKNYMEEILKLYKTNPMAKGVQGFIINFPFNPSNIRHLIFNSVKKVFLLDYFEKNRCTRRRGLCYPYSPEGIIECEWLHGSNMSFRREVLANFRFDDYVTLRGRSIGEDVRLSSKIYTYYPHSLFMNPQAKACHIQNPRKIDEYSIYLTISYFIYRSMTAQGSILRNTARACWSSLGRLIIDGGSMLLVSKDIRAFFCLMKSCLFAINHFENVRKGDFRFINSLC